MQDHVERLARYLFIQAAMIFAIAAICFAQSLYGLRHPSAFRQQSSSDTTFLIVQACNGTFFVIVATLHMIAAMRLRELRRRGLILVVVYSNLFWLLTCLLTPTAFLVLLEGLRVLYNRDVRWAFGEVRRGRTAADVWQSPLPRYNDERDDYDDDPTIYDRR